MYNRRELYANMIGKQVSLNTGEQIVAKVIAKLRYEENRKNGVHDKKIGPQNNEETDLGGIGGEIAFCKLFNLMPDLSIKPRSAKKDNGDCYFANGQAIDVKTTHYKTGKLIAVPWKEISTIFYYALMIGTFPHYKFLGFMTRDELLKAERLGDLGHGDTYIAYQEELKNLIDILLDNANRI